VTHLRAIQPKQNHQPRVIQPRVIQPRVIQPRVMEQQQQQQQQRVEAVPRAVSEFGDTESVRDMASGRVSDKILQQDLLQLAEAVATGDQVRGEGSGEGRGIRRGERDQARGEGSGEGRGIRRGERDQARGEGSGEGRGIRRGERVSESGRVSDEGLQQDLLPLAEAVTTGDQPRMPDSPSASALLTLRHANAALLTLPAHCLRPPCALPSPPTPCSCAAAYGQPGSSSASALLPLRHAHAAHRPLPAHSLPLPLPPPLSNPAPHSCPSIHAPIQPRMVSLTRRLRPLSSPYGTPMQRVSHYLLTALAKRAAGALGTDYITHLSRAPEVRKQ
ncbi:unnamed protein product, partial [Closterium sp. Naga37s-1]